MLKNNFFGNLIGKNIWIVGIGVSNTDVITLFADKGLTVTVCDRATRAQLGDVCEKLEAKGVKLRVGEDYPQSFAEADVLIRTPGMYYNSPELLTYRQKGGVLTSEMELFFDLCPATTVAVTGSDGKTTTTTLIAEMLKAEGKTVHLGGNIGRALLPIVENISATDYAVVELSSFQLISIRKSPDIAVITNVTPNHLDVHGEMGEYIDAKRNIYLHQNAFSKTVIGMDNDISASFAKDIRGDEIGFSACKKLENGVFLEDGVIYSIRHGQKAEKILSVNDIILPGAHNVENYMAAIAAVRDIVKPENIQKVAKEFGGVEHRIEYLGIYRGARWYNDSIATTPTRAIAGLKSFDEKIIMIAGGYDKKIPFEPLAPEIIKHVKTLILIGATASKIEEALKKAEGYSATTPKILHGRDLPDAVELAYADAQEGDVVTLSPACASFDSYKNFEVRGNHFKELVKNLK